MSSPYVYCENRCRDLFLCHFFMSFLGISVFLRRYSHDFGEKAREIEGILESHLVAYLVDFHIRGIQQFAGFLDLQLIEIAQRTVTRGTLEDGREMGVGVSGIFGQIVQTDGLLQVLFHIFQCGIDDAMSLAFIQFLFLWNFLYCGI